MASGVFIAQFGVKTDQGIGPIIGLATEEVKIEERLNTPSQWTFTIASQYVRPFNENFRALMQDVTPRAYVRVGISVDGRVGWQPWQFHIIKRIRSIPRTDSHMILMSTADSYAEIDRGSKITARQGKISDMVQEIADENGLEAEIEVTEGAYNLVQSMISDYEFICQRLIPRAINRADRADYRTYIRDNKLHFHTLGYRSREPVLVRLFSRPTTRTVLSDDTQRQIDFGSSGVEYYAFNPYEASTVISTSENPKFKQAKSAPFDNTPEFRLQVRGNIGQNVGEPRAVVQSNSDRARQANYNAELSQDGMMLHVDDLVSIDATHSSLKLSPWSGSYVVSVAKHLIKRGGLTSEIRVMRGEIN